jgi:hypothetical protein
MRLVWKASAGAAELVQLTACLSRWLDERGLAPRDLSSEVIESFLVDLLPVSRFLDQVPAPIEVGLRQLSVGQIT